MHAIKLYRGVAPHILTLTLDASKQSASRPVRYTSGKQPCAYRIRRWVGSRAGLDVVKKIQILSPAGIQTPDRPVRSPATILPTLSILFSSLAQ